MSLSSLWFILLIAYIIKSVYKQQLNNNQILQEVPSYEKEEIKTIWHCYKERS